MLVYKFDSSTWRVKYISGGSQLTDLEGLKPDQFVPSDVASTLPVYNTTDVSIEPGVGTLWFRPADAAIFVVLENDEKEVAYSRVGHGTRARISCSRWKSLKLFRRKDLEEQIPKFIIDPRFDALFKFEDLHIGGVAGYYYQGGVQEPTRSGELTTPQGLLLHPGTLLAQVRLGHMTALESTTGKRFRVLEFAPEHTYCVLRGWEAGRILIGGGFFMYPCRPNPNSTNTIMYAGAFFKWEDDDERIAHIQPVRMPLKSYLKFYSKTLEEIS